jgi:peptidyl-prolyl cis-trans isomerase SurA
MAALLLALLQGSLLVSPMYLADQPPEGRSVQGLLVVHQGTPGVSRSIGRSRDEARALAEATRERLARGADFAALARASSEHASSRFGGVLGTVWPGMLARELDAFLFEAEVGELSEVIESDAGFHVLRRIERDVAWRQVRVDGTGSQARARCAELLERLRAGADFATLAREASDDPVTAARGGVAGIFQRGPRDALLKTAAFQAEVGQVVGPVETPFALFVLQRIDPAGVDPALREPVAVRLRAILIAFTGAVGADPILARSSQDAEEVALELATRIRAGEDMAALAREWNDDPGGRDRAGDLGWILRQASDVPSFLDQACVAEVGELVGPVPSDKGWVLVRRER